MPQSTKSGPSRSTTGRGRLTLDDLSARKWDELGELYRHGSVPSDFSALENKPKGRMVAVRGLAKSPLNPVVAALSKSGLFPWDGKSFGSTGDRTGEGINRINLLRLYRPDWFVFTTRVEPSVIDGEDTIFLDYAQPGNPFFIRAIHDEIREVAPGLYLGPAMAKLDDGNPTMVLWFALDTNQPSEFAE